MQHKKLERIINNARPLVQGLNRDKKHVSLILRKGNVIAAGINVRQTHPKAKEFGYMYDEMHSELDAIRKVPKTQRDGLVLINLRFNNRGDLRMAKPCKNCTPWVLADFDRIWFSNRLGIMERLK